MWSEIYEKFIIKNIWNLNEKIYKKENLNKDPYPGDINSRWLDPSSLFNQNNRSSFPVSWKKQNPVKVSKEDVPWVDLSDFLDESLWLSDKSEDNWEITSDAVKLSQIELASVLSTTHVTFSDDEISKEVNQFLSNFLASKRLDYFRDELKSFLKKLNSILWNLRKIDNYKDLDDYKKIYALKIFFINIEKIYEYLALTIFDFVKSNDKEKFDKWLILNTIRRRLNIEITNSEFDDLTQVFWNLKNFLTSNSKSIVDICFEEQVDHKKLFDKLNQSFPNLVSVSEIDRVVNNKKTVDFPWASGKLIEIEEKDFHTEVLNSEIPVIVDFYWPNCPPCKTLQPILEQLASKYKWRVKFVKIDVSKPNTISWSYNVSWTPTVIAFNWWKTHWNPIVWVKSWEYEPLIKSVMQEFEKDPTNQWKMFPKPDIKWKDYIINWVDFSDPKSIVEYLDIYATGQEHAKEVLAIAFSRFITQWIVTSQLIVWPSWSWKTYMTNLLCNLTWLKFVNIWISTLSSAWIKWANLKEQLETLKWHKWKAILFLDEIDKLADSNNPHGQWIQNELLTLFNTDSPSEEYAWIDLKNIMILWAWAFEDNWRWKSLYAMLKKKAGNKANVFESLDDSDLIDYWLKPEIVWRLTWKTYLNALTVEQLYEMMTKKWSETAKLTKEFEDSHIELVFTDEALLEIARTAHNWVGARAIKSILERIIKPISVRKVELAWKSIEINKQLVEEVISVSNTAEKDIDWNDTKSIIAYLDRFVPWNAHAKRALANSFKEFMVYGKLSHTFIYWESWSWKTYMISLLCKAAWIQMWEASMANVTSSWFKWINLSEVITNSFSRWYMWKSPKKVLFLDEIDKLINRGWRLWWWNFWEEIINELLSIFNWTSETWIDLSNCLIISAWACAGNTEWKSLKQIVQERIGWINKINDNSLLEQVEKDDLEAYWFKTELVWRFKRVSFLESVNREYLRQVMFNSEWSVYKKKLQEAEFDGFNIKLSDESIEVVLKEAEAMRTWVRALETVLNRLFDKIYDDFAKWDVEIDWDYTDKVLNPKAKFEHPDMDKIDWTSPQTVRAYLDTKAQGNELYKQSLSLMFWKLKRKIDTWNDNIKIPNLLVLWPSGWGKTYLLKLLAPLLWIPFSEINVATVESDYPNSKIWDVFDSIGKNVKIAIIFIDEIDKILMNPRHPLNNELMSYLESWNYEGRDLSQFIFVWAWAFQWHNVTDNDWNVNLISLQSAWVKPEVLGRFWNVCWIEKMNIEKMRSILLSDWSVFNQRVKSIQDEYGISVVLEEGVLDYICEVAIKQPTWARALELITNVIFNWFEYRIWQYLEKGEINLDMENVKSLLANLDS